MWSRSLSLLSRSSLSLFSRSALWPTTITTRSPASQMQMRGMKVRSAVKKLCASCASVRRKGKVNDIFMPSQGITLDVSD